MSLRSFINRGSEEQTTKSSETFSWDNYIVY